MKTKEKPQLHQDWIHPHALEIVNKLQNKGYTTYLVGGCVRDLLLGYHPKDFDISTIARPQEIRQAVPRSYIIGKRFRLVLVRRSDHQYEVSTFRRDLRADENPENLPDGDNLFGTPEEDACRRDFTINALFYDPVKDKLIDYSEGMEDLESGWIRMIGDPYLRLKEDPIRILRAIRLAHKIRFSIEPQLRKAIEVTAPQLQQSVLPRRREEFLKFLRLENPALPFLESFDMGVLYPVAPVLSTAFEKTEDQAELLQQLSQLNSEGVPESPLELFGGLVRSFVRTTIEPDPQTLLKSPYLEDNVELHQLMKHELGLHKYEQSLVLKALHMEGLLCRRKEFEKRGPRRQMAILSHEAFPLALDLARKDMALSPDDLYFWQDRFLKAQQEIHGIQSRRAQKKRRKKGQKRKKKSSSGNSKEDVDEKSRIG